MIAAAKAARSSCTLVPYERLFVVCDRCGLAWRGDQKPACSPMTVGRMRAAVEREIADHEASHRVLVNLADSGLPTDPLAALARVAGLRSVLLLVNRVFGDARILRQVREGSP